MTNQVIVTRYDETEEQTRGYNKILTAIQAYEEILIAFEKYVCRKYSEALSAVPKPTWWQKNMRELTQEDLLIAQGDEEWALVKLYHWIEKDTLTDQVYWHPMESLAFNDKVDVARHYETYDNLRNLIRCGSTFLLDDATCKFVNTFNKRLTIFH